MKLRYLLLIAFMLATACLPAQVIPEECGTDAAHNYLFQTDSAYREKMNEVEGQIRNILVNPASNRLQSLVYTIPVVVHVIHLGEAVGSGTNISDAQIQGAIQAMNNRYANLIGSGLDVQIQFCLATRDPNGNPSSGINRVDGSGITNYSSQGIYIGGCGTGANEESVKSLSRWPVSGYYNIWVVNKICNGQYSGWAYYPFGGVNDGTVIRYSSMTSSSTTLTHELGHGFYLYHTFNGDGGNSYCPANNSCIDDGDKVCDTPPHKQSDCGTTDPCTGTGTWFYARYNYMSYCGSLNRFTQGQKDRMRAAAEVSPRLSLLSSVGCMPVSANDAGIEEVAYPIKSTYTQNCNFPNTVSPVVKLKNYGTSSLTSATIHYKLDGGTAANYSWNGNLASGNSADVTLPGIALSTGSHLFLAYTSIPNGTADGYALNDSADMTFDYKAITPFLLSVNSTNASCNGSSNGAASVSVTNRTEILEDWESSTDWIFKNGSQVNQWNVGTSTSNGGMKCVYISNDGNSNAYTINTTSLVHFYKDFYFPAGATNITVKFDWKNVGQSGADYLRVYLVPVTTIPAAGYQLSTGQIGNTYVGQSNFSTASITGLDGNAGQVKRLVFSWRNDISTGTQTPAAVDNVLVSYVMPAGTPYSYLWNSSPAQSTQTANNLPAGNYSVIVSDATGCTGSASATVSQPPPVSASVTPGGPTAFCLGETVQLTANTSSSYLWSTGAMTQSIVVAVTGNYSVTVTNGSGCTGTSPVIPVTVNPCSGILDLRVLIEGFYLGGGQMQASVNPALYPALCDTVKVELRDPSYPHAIAFSETGTIDIYGNGSFQFPAMVEGNSYYVVVRHRNALETWSASPVYFSSLGADYSFSDAIVKAYGSNLSDLGDGRFALWSGDVSDASTATVGLQDGVVESQDYSDMENAVISLLTGYIPQDITGDRVVESSDYSIIENNVYFTVISIHP